MRHTLLVATTNTHKLGELRQLLADLPLDLIAPTDVWRAPPTVVEDGVTFAENARKKAVSLARASGLLTLADDSGLEVDALGGAPGVRSARYAHERATDGENRAALLAALYVWICVPESAVWRVERERARAVAGARTAVVDARAGRVAVREIFAPGLRRKTLLGTLAAACALTGYWGANTWLPTYLVRERGLDAAAMARYVLLLNAGMFVGYQLLGWLADRIGHKRSLELFTLVALAGYLLVILVPDWRMVLAGSVLFISWTAVSLPAIMSLVSKAVPKDRRSLGVSLHSFTRRVPMALGPLAGGLLINAYGKVQGTRAAFCAAFAMASARACGERRCCADP